MSTILSMIFFSRKINYPSTDRNKTPILGILQKFLDPQKDGKVLEIASGSGQHVAFFASHFPKLSFQPSECETTLFDSIRAYAADIPSKNVKEPAFINVLDDWKKWNIPYDFDYAININMIHVAPFTCTIGLFRNVSFIFKNGGLLIMYGPYANNGVLEPQSNRDFDRRIRERDPNCGVRDIQDLIKIAESYGIRLINIHEMPANNKCLIWEKN